MLVMCGVEYWLKEIETFTEKEENICIERVIGVRTLASQRC